MTAASLADELEVCTRTIKRDIETLRNEHGAEIVWEPSTATYICEKPSEHLPLLRLTADEAIALNLAGKTFAAWGGSPLGRALQAALGKIGQVVGNSVSLPADAMGDLVFQPDDAGAAEATRRWFALLLESIQHRKTLKLTYHKPFVCLTEVNINWKEGISWKTVHTIVVYHRSVIIVKVGSYPVILRKRCSRTKIVFVIGMRIFE